MDSSTLGEEGVLGSMPERRFGCNRGVRQRPDAEVLTIRFVRSLLERTYTGLYASWDEYHENVDTNREVGALEIAQWMEPGRGVLDAGCGDGLNGKLIAERTGAHVEGCDIVDKANHWIQGLGDRLGASP